MIRYGNTEVFKTASTVCQIFLNNVHCASSSSWCGPVKMHRWARYSSWAIVYHIHKLRCIH